MKHVLVFASVICLCFVLLLVNCAQETSGKVDLSPANWPEGEMEKYAEMKGALGTIKPAAEGMKAMISGTSGSLAVRSGLEALKQGGSAADAAMTTSLAQIVLLAGSEISYAGHMNMVYYEAKSGQIYVMNAGYNTVQEEKNPLTIPPLGTPSGRAVLVPGFMAGVQAAHDRFGKLPFEQLFVPSIYFAEQGFILDSGSMQFIDPMNARETLWNRLPEMKAVFTKEDGEFYKEGDLFKQPALAKTLRNVAAQGADYMYRGEWAKKFVSAVQSQGGKMTVEDLENYSVIWPEPLHSKYRGFDIYTLGEPDQGGTNILEALNLCEASEILESGHYTSSPEVLYWLIQISRTNMFVGGSEGMGMGLPPEAREKLLPKRDFSRQDRITKDWASQLWQKMKKNGGWVKVYESMINPKPKSNHSAGVVAVDEEGNVAAVLHSINTVGWGYSGIFVDGVSANDSASFQQPLIKAVGPGARLPNSTCTLIVMKDGKPFLASSTIGTGLFEETLQSVVNVLDFGMDARKAAEEPTFGRAGSLEEFLSGGNLGAILKAVMKQTVMIGDFTDDILDAVRAMGQEFTIMPKGLQGNLLSQGNWVGITIDPKTGKMIGGTAPALDGCAAGY